MNENRYFRRDILASLLGFIGTGFTSLFSRRSKAVEATSPPPEEPKVLSLSAEKQRESYRRMGFEPVYNDRGKIVDFQLYSPPETNPLQGTGEEPGPTSPGDTGTGGTIEGHIVPGDTDTTASRKPVEK